ncbi:mms19 nucleotide excision repair [Physocladia obscura]|uniref:MMS19 nucleotide excision repair protein n=1 Tax=Physocladia obscura TaxID=109957 RepID=A0AAD5XIX6_9FUNG|nr:mms19 nucleotide excision repair [Physocladia obscura]
MAELVNGYLNDPESTFGQKALSELGARVVDREITLLDLVRLAGGALTAADPFERAKAVSLLAGVLAGLTITSPAPTVTPINAPNIDRVGALDRRTVAVLAQFVRDRLHDTQSVEDLLRAFQALLDSRLVSRNDAIETTRSIFKELNVQNFSQNVRFSAYRVFQSLLSLHLDGMKILGDNFIAGFLVAMDGEKDPRNILFCFSIVKFIIFNFDISGKFEDLFEAIYCYFPITFRPPPNDPYGITSKDLKLQLRNCFAATPLFGKLAWPILIEKLSSTSENAKLDAMETITACAPIYGGESIRKNLDELWEQLLEEILDSKPEVQRLAALQAITAVTYSLSTSSTSVSLLSSTDTLAKFLDNIIKYSLADLLEGTAPKESVRHLLFAAIKATEPSFYYVSTKVVKPILQSLIGAVANESRAAKYAVLRDFLLNSKTFYGDSTSMQDDSLPQNPLLPFKEEFFQNFSSALSSKNEFVVISGLRALAVLSTLAEFMSDHEVEWYFQTLLGIAINEPKAIIDVVIEILIEEANFRVDKVLTYVVPQLLEACTLASASEQAVLNSFECLVVLSDSSHNVVSVVVPALVQILQIETQNLEQVRNVISALEIIFVDRKLPIPQLDVVDVVVIPTLRTLVTRKIDDVWLYTDVLVIESVSRLFSSVMRTLDSRTQELLASVVVNSLFKGDMTDLGISEKPELAVADAKSALRNVSWVLAAVICNLRPEASILNVDIRSMLNYFVQTTIFNGTTEDAESNGYAFRIFEIVASILNKSNAEVVADFLADNNRLFKIIGGQEKTSLRIHSLVVVLLLWVTRALVMKRSSASELAKVTEFIDLLKNEGGDVIASNFYILAADDPSFGRGTLTKSAFAKTALLWQQKQFKHALPLLVAGFNEHDNLSKSVYLLALSHLMKYVAKSVILYEIKNLIPLLLAGLASKNVQLTHTILEVIQTLLKDAPQALAEHIESFVILLLQLTGGDSKSQSVDVRVLALKCLGQIPKTDITFNILFVLKPRVISGLQGPLDDGVKVVRKEAGNARAKWFLLLGKN